MEHKEMVCKSDKGRLRWVLMKTPELSPPIEAVPMARVADVAGVSHETLRGQVHKGRIPGAFVEYSWPKNRRARWFIPLDSAVAICIAKQVEYDALNEHIESVVPDPVQRDRS